MKIIANVRLIGREKESARYSDGDSELWSSHCAAGSYLFGATQNWALEGRVVTM